MYKSEKIFLKCEKIFQIVMFFRKSSLKSLSNLKNRSAMRTCVAYKLHFKLG